MPSHTPRKSKRKSASAAFDATPIDEEKEKERRRSKERRRVAALEKKLLEDENAALVATKSRMRKQIEIMDQQAVPIDNPERESPPTSESSPAAASLPPSGTESDDGEGDDDGDSYSDSAVLGKSTDVTRAMETMARALEFDKRCRRVTGLTVAVFHEQVAAYTPMLSQTTNDGRLATYTLKPKRWKVQPQLQFFITFVWLRMYFTSWFMAEYFHLGFRMIAKVLKRVTSAMERTIASPTFPVAAGKVVLPTAAELDAALRFNSYNWDGLRRPLALDGMHLVTYARSVPDEKTDKAAHDKALRELKQPKHACYGTLALIVCDMGGRIVWYTTPQTGHEQSLLKESNLRAAARAADAVILSDAGLHLNRKADAVADRCRTSQSVGPGLIRLMSLVVKNPTYFTPELVQWCRQVYYTARHVSQLRIVVENVIGQLRFWAIVRLAFRGKFLFNAGVIAKKKKKKHTYCVTQSTAFACVVALSNAMRAATPLRAANWAPDTNDFPADFKPGYPDCAQTKQPFANINGIAKAAAALLTGEKKKGVKQAFVAVKKRIKAEQRIIGKKAAAIIADDSTIESDYDGDDDTQLEFVECPIDKDYVVSQRKSKVAVDADVAAGLKPSRHFTKAESARKKAEDRAARDEQAAKHEELAQQKKDSAAAAKKRSSAASAAVAVSKKSKK
jgi:hypothetical protein